jgi:serine/threonine-protein kinase
MDPDILATRAESQASPFASSGEGSSAAGLDPEVHQEQSRRLAGLALTYVVGYTLFYGYSWALCFMSGWKMIPSTIESVMFVFALVIGLGTYFLGRDARIPARHFLNYVVAFQIVTSFVIAGSVWGWEKMVDRDLHVIGEALGFGTDIKNRLVDPLVAKGIRLMQQGGVSGVGIWAMIFPFVMPLSTRRTLLGSGLSILSLPILLYGSMAAHGTPETIRAWMSGIIADITIPSAIAAAIGVIGSRTHYKLTRELARVKRMGSYQLVEKIGAGGMGEVWRAKHRLLVRPAAIKLIRPEGFGADEGGARNALARFDREAQATSTLSSPHSIELYDFGVTEDGTFYYVMELLNGLDLRSLVDRFGPVPAERAVFLLRQACHSLADAHANGIIHRDVKPANIFTCRRGLDLDFVKVLDFGLVKHQGSTERTQLTMEGIASGTPAFMAPEMATGDRPVDSRADLYALGCVAYWLLTGKLVFEAGTAVQTLLRHVRDVPEPPSKRTEIEVPAELDAIVLALLEKEPERRPADARELSARLAACQSRLPEWTPERARHWWSVHVPATTPAA